MLNIPLPSEEDLAAYDAGVETGLHPVEDDSLPAPGIAEGEPDSAIEINPLLYGFMVALFLLLLGGGLLLVHLQQAFPPPADAAPLLEVPGISGERP